MAEKEGFEPSKRFCRLHDFQSCALDQLGDFSIAVKHLLGLTCVPSGIDSVIIIAEKPTKSSLIFHFFKIMRRPERDILSPVSAHRISETMLSTA